MAVVRALALESFATDADRRLRADYLAEQERFGCMPPEWRFAWVGPDRRVGARVTYWGPPGAAAPMLVDTIHADVDDAADPTLDAADPTLAAADPTLAAVFAASVAALRIDAIEYFADRRVPAATALGFSVIATQTRLAHSAPVAPAAVPAGVALRSIAELGYDALVELVPAIQDGSADRGTRDDDPACLVASLRELDHDPAWWELAVDRATGAPLGFVAPARTRDGGHVIALIGVAATARRRGIGRCLLATGTAALRRVAPDARIIADVDDTNPAMLGTAAAVGYQPFAARVHYRYAKLTRP